MFTIFFSSSSGFYSFSFTLFVLSFFIIFEYLCSTAPLYRLLQNRVGSGAFGAVHKCDLPPSLYFEEESHLSYCYPTRADKADASIVVKVMELPRRSGGRDVTHDVFHEVGALQMLRGSGSSVELLDFGCLDASRYVLVMRRCHSTLTQWRSQIDLDHLMEAVPVMLRVRVGNFFSAGRMRRWIE